MYSQTRNIRNKVYYISKLKQKESFINNNIYNTINTKTISLYIMSSIKSKLKYVGYASLAYATYKIYSKRKTLPNTIMTYVKTPFSIYFSSLLKSKEVKGEGLHLLEKIFKEKLLHETLLVLLKSNLKEKSFVEESKIYGKSLIKKIVTEKEFKKEIKDFSIKTIKNQEIKQESLLILKYLIDDETAKHDIKMYMQYVWLRHDVMEKLNHLFMKSAIVALTSEPFKAYCLKFFTEMSQDKDLKWSMIGKALPKFSLSHKTPKVYLTSVNH